jgi:integrase
VESPSDGSILTFILMLRRTNAVQLGVDHAEGLTKGRKARSVPVPQTVLELLAKQCEGRGLDDLVFGDGTN